MNNIVAKRELLQLGAAPGSEGLMLTQDGWVAEGIVNNLFFARGGVIYTPSIDTGILPGVTRGRVIELIELRATPLLKDYSPGMSCFVQMKYG